jgi:hypothetical protein
MPRYKVETLVYYSRLTLDKDHIAKRSRTEIQKMLDEHAGSGWRLVSTNATSFGLAVYIYLYFETDATAG